MGGARHFGVGVESTYGTGVAPTDFLNCTEEDVSKNITFEEVSDISTWSVRKQIELTQACGGEVTVLGNYQNQGLLLKNFYGGVTTTGGGPYVHTFPATAGIPAAGRATTSLTLELRRDGTLNWRYLGCKVISMGVTWSVEQMARWTWGFLGKDDDTAQAPATASYPEFDPMIPKNTTALTFDGSALGLRGTSVNINAAFPVDEPHDFSGLTFPVEPCDNGPFQVTGDVGVIFDDLTQYAKFDGATDVDIEITNGDGTHSVTFNINKCRLTASPVNFSGRDRLTGTYTFAAYYDAVATEAMQVVLTNDDATIP